MSLKKTLSTMTRPLSLVLEDKALLPEPLLAVALYDFEGEPEMAELTFSKGQMLMVFCEDFGASWSLAMLVDAQGNELDEGANGGPILTRGLIAQGFYEYVSEPASRPASQERHQDVDARDAELDGAPPSSPTDTIKGPVRLNEYASDGAPPKPAPEAAAVLGPVSADLSADYLEASESSIESSVIVVAPDEDEIQSHNNEVETSHETSAASVPYSPDTASPTLGSEILPSEPEPSPADASLSQPVAIQTAPLIQRSIPNGKTRTRQTSTNSLLKSVNPVEAYLNSDLPHEPDELLPARDIIEIADGHWVSKIPPLKITVPSYFQRKVAKGRGEYTVFQIVSSINAPIRLPTTEEQLESTEGTAIEVKEATNGEQDIRHIAVDRRYTHFQHLHTILKASLPLLSIPDLPEKRLTGNFNADFLNGRRRDLERYLSRLARHNLIRSNKAFLDFLGCENEEVYDANLPRSLMHALRMEPERFFTKIKYESEHFDESQLLEEVKEEQERMARHVRAVEKGQAISSISDGLTAYCDRMQDTGTALSNIAIGLISLVSGLAQPRGLPTTSAAAEDEDHQTESTDRTRRRRERARAHNMQNDDGAFCWRDECKKCLSTTKAVQETAEAIALVAELYDANARTVLVAPQEQLVEYSLPRQRYQTLLSNAKLAQDHLAQLVKQEDEDEEGSPETEGDKKRSEVVLNSLLAEIEQIHTERREDLQKVALTLLNGQIAFHERALVKLQAARVAFEPERLEEFAHQGPRLPSILEKAVLDPPKPKPALPKPSSFGLPAAPQSASLKPITSLVSNLFSGAVSISSSWRSAISAIKAQTPTGTDGGEDLRERLASPTLASSSRFVQFLDWTMNSRGEQRQYA